MEHRIITEESDYKQFEKGLKIAYRESEWRKKNYSHTEDRMIPHYQYNQMIVVGSFEKDKLIGAASFISSHNEKLIVEERGFQIPEGIQRNNLIEGLDFYSLSPGLATLRIMKKTFSLATEEAKRMGKTGVAGSCYPDIFPIYRKSGAEIIESKIIDGKEEVFFIVPL